MVKVWKAGANSRLIEKCRSKKRQESEINGMAFVTQPKFFFKKKHRIKIKLALEKTTIVFRRLEIKRTDIFCGEGFLPGHLDRQKTKTK